jgi:hypothetical protein
MSDAITLTIPRERPYHSVAHLVLGGLAARLNLTIETFEDLELALDALLERRDGDEPVTVEARLTDDRIEVAIGPFREASIRAEMEHDGPDDELGLRRVLDTLADGVELQERGDACWVRMEKSLKSMETA